MVKQKSILENMLPLRPEKNMVFCSSSYLSIIVPTRNETENIEPLLKRIEDVTKDYLVDVTFVDDSTDNTPQTIIDAKEQSAINVQLIARPPERRNGLGKAVVEGLHAVTGQWVIVMDGDLQHPPEIIPKLVKRAEEGSLDVVVASRLTHGGGTDGLNWYRKLISYFLAILSRLLFPNSLRNVSDPMTGFFLLRRDAISIDSLQPNGFKILLEILCKNPDVKVGEIPFQFGERFSGTSKANGQEMWRLFQQMFRLRFANSIYLLKFGVVGLTGLIVNTLLMYIFTDLLKFHYLESAIFATQGSTLWNFIWTDKWVFDNRANMKMRLLQRMGGFYIINNLLLVARAPFLTLFVSILGIHYLIANVITLGLMTLVRYGASDKVLWQQHREENMKTKTFYYNIHDILHVRSMQRLPELGYFISNEVLENPSIDVHIVSDPCLYRTQDSVIYQEVVGRFGFSIVINRGDDVTNVYATSLISKSPHVLYTNVVEPLLRWNFVRKGYALMHGASIAFDDHALFITAQTDTGKTTTILYTIKANRDTVRFLSDDMTIFKRDGYIYNYPKPLTISQHTLQAVGGSPLTLRERLFLQVQSRLHSRQGRFLGMLLSKKNFPAATLNAIVQAIIPPPKFMVDKLVPGTQYINSARLAHIVLIERGEDLETEINDLEKVSMLVANAEDAYGFPPYPVLAEQLSTWDGKNLHEAEREIVAATIQNVPGTYLRDSNYGWYKRLPQLIQQMGCTAADPEVQTLFKHKAAEVAKVDRTEVQS